MSNHKKQDKKQDRKIRNIIYEMEGIVDICPQCGSANIEIDNEPVWHKVLFPTKKCNDCKSEWFYRKELEEEEKKEKEDTKDEHEKG